MKYKCSTLLKICRMHLYYFLVHYSLFLVRYCFQVLVQYLDEFMLISIFHQPDNAAGIGFAKDIFAVGFNGTFAEE